MGVRVHSFLSAAVEYVLLVGEELMQTMHHNMRTHAAVSCCNRLGRLVPRFGVEA